MLKARARRHWPSSNRQSMEKRAADQFLGPVALTFVEEMAAFLDRADARNDVDFHRARHEFTT